MSAITWARTAFDYTKGTLVIGAGNQPQRVDETDGLSATYVNRLRRQPGAWQRTRAGGWEFEEPQVRAPLSGRTTVERYKMAAARARAYRAGNCGEHAAVAFEYLIEHAPAECGLIAYAKCKRPGDHCFVWVDVASGPDAVICDAWGGFVCTVGQLNAQVGGSHHVARGTDPEDVARVQRYIIHYDYGADCFGNLGTTLVHVANQALAAYTAQFPAGQTRTGFRGHDLTKARTRIQALTTSINNATTDAARVDALQTFLRDFWYSFKAGSLKLMVVQQFYALVFRRPAADVTTQNAQARGDHILSAMRETFL